MVGCSRKMNVLSQRNYLPRRSERVQPINEKTTKYKSPSSTHTDNFRQARTPSVLFITEEPCYAQLQ